MTRDFYLTKKNSTSRTMFPATELENGMLIGTNRLPMVIGDELKDAGFTASDLTSDVDSLPEALAEIVLRVGENRGHLVERRETPEERKAREKAERDAQNAFLREKGYRWEKRNFYCSGEVGDIVDYWALLDPDGTEVVGKRDGGGRIEEFGYVKGLLRQLGYYGQDAIDEHNARVAEQERVAAERSEAREKVDAYFENATPHTPTPDLEERSLSLISISASSRTRYAITDKGIWKLIYNGMDGDDWSYNNYSMYMASRYDYDADVAEAIEFLSC